MNIMLLVIGFIALVIGGEFLVRSSVALSFKLNISRLVIGMTVVSFATSVPELLVSLTAAFKGSTDIAITNVVGSNIANIGLVLGITTIIGGITVTKRFLTFEWPVMVIFSLMAYYFLYNDTKLSAAEGAILFATLIVFIILLLKRSKKETNIDEVDDGLTSVSYFKIFAWLAIGGLALFYGSNWLVLGATDLAKQIGVSDAVIGATIIAFGTSVPELAASIIAAIKKEKAISLGNLIGSNIFNIGSVLGLTSIIKTIPVTDPKILSSDIFWMLAFALVLLPLILLPKKHQIGRFKGLILVLGYSVFLVFAFKS